MENFGKKAKDKITGFEGVITALCHYMYGCSQYLLTPTIDEAGKRRDGEWFDTGRIEIKEQVFTADEVHGDKDGCEFREHPCN